MAHPVVAWPDSRECERAGAVVVTCVGQQRPEAVSQGGTARCQRVITLAIAMSQLSAVETDGGSHNRSLTALTKGSPCLLRTS